MEAFKSRPSGDVLPLAVTMGDPAGIGPDVTISAWLARSDEDLPPFAVLGDAAVFRARAAKLGLDSFPIADISTLDAAEAAFFEGLPVLPAGASLSHEAEPGLPDSRNSEAILQSIDLAVALALEGKAEGVVTNPISKHVLLSAGFRHAGHTEYLAELASAAGAPKRTAIMLMASAPLMAVPLTVHIPLNEVPRSVTRQRISETVAIIHDDFQRYFSLPRPRIAVCGLNPHAGESGDIGREEIDIIAPAIKELQEQGYAVSGPYPADTLFHEAARSAYDAVLAMYHDQALIPFKTLAFEDGVNATLGLPFVRTSPDHGTAFSLAGTGTASASSFIAALKLAARMRANEKAYVKSRVSGAVSRA